ncbi:MAG TPA: hypothetical protein DD827_07910 [Gammaproteobacteria bacterium]|jgi:2-polyprenyl-3-methyl-5-hydroxy-6-metoxy-1,4-benzoquinol methylase|nr:hypothetical protein [Gammaproteobacteria bacterium]
MTIENTCEVCGSTDFRTILDYPMAEARDCSYAECDHCKLVRVINGPPIFDYSDAGYLETLTRQAINGTRLWEWTVEQIHHHRQPGVLIEVGCGVGAQLAVASHQGWQASGYELNPLCADIAELLYRVDIKRDDFLQRPETHDCDVVLMNQFIEHVPDPKPFLKSSRQALKPGGIIVMSTPNWNFASLPVTLKQRYGTSLPRTDHIQPTQHIRLYRPQTMEVLAKEMGLKVVEIKENPTDFLGKRCGLSARRLIGHTTRLLEKFSQHKLQFGVNMMVIMRAAEAD